MTYGSLGEKLFAVDESGGLYDFFFGAALRHYVCATKLGAARSSGIDVDSLEREEGSRYADLIRVVSIVNDRLKERFPLLPTRRMELGELVANELTALTLHNAS